jgi:hypothetical protein
MIVEKFTPSSIGRWNAFRPLISPMPPARLLTTAVFTASCKIIFAGCTAGIDEPCTSHIAVGYLVSGKVNRIIGCQFIIDPLIEFSIAEELPVFSALITAIVCRQLLLHNIGTDGYTQMVCLAGKVG